MMSASHVSISTSPRARTVRALSRFRVLGEEGGVVTVRTNWFMGEEHLEPAWTFGPEGERLEVEAGGGAAGRWRARADVRTYPHILRGERGGDPQQRLQRPPERRAERSKHATHNPEHRRPPPGRART